MSKQKISKLNFYTVSVHIETDIDFIYGGVDEKKALTGYNNISINNIEVGWRNRSDVNAFIEKEVREYEFIHELDEEFETEEDYLIEDYYNDETVYKHIDTQSELLDSKQLDRINLITDNVLSEVTRHFGGKYSNIYLDENETRLLKLRIADHSGKWKNKGFEDYFLSIVITESNQTSDFKNRPEGIKSNEEFYFDSDYTSKEIIEFINDKITDLKESLDGVSKKYKRKIDARMTTLKAKKSGTDLFPELAGVTDVLFTFLNSFLGLDNTVVSRTNLTHLINTLHIAIKDKAIKPNHPLKNLVNQTQTKIVNLINSLSPNEKIKLSISNRQEIETKISSLSSLGFWNVIASAVIGKGAELLANKHIFNKKPTPQTLSGVMSVTQAINGKFDLIGLDGNYLKLIGEACRPTSFFIYGPGGSGKSTFTVLFSNYLAQKNNKVLYVAGEQFGTPVFSKMLTRLNIIDTQNFAIVKDLNTVSPKDFDFIAIDSKDSLNFYLENFIAMRKQFPHLSFVILSQGTKSGSFTGSEKWRNEVDTLLYCENLRVHSNLDKNRWGGSAEFDILKLNNLKK